MKLLKSRTFLTFLLVPFALLAVFLWPYVDCYGQMHFNLAEEISLGDFSISHVDCGSDNPTVIIEAGLNQSKRSYFGLQKNLMSTARVITYDHAGTGESTISGNPRTLPFYVQELESFIASKNLKPPFIIIGHSMGGYVARYFAHMHPNDVAGLVLLDSAHEDWNNHVKNNWPEKEREEFLDFFNPEITSQEQVRVIERAMYEKNQDIIRDIQIPTHIPVLMFTGIDENHQRKDKEGKLQDNYKWASMQLSLLKFHEKNAKQIIDWDTGHWPQYDKPQQVSKEIRHFIKSTYRK